MASRNPGKANVYRMLDRRGRTVKFGITNNPRRRARENARDGLGSTLQVVSKKLPRQRAKGLERGLIRGFRSNHGRKPPGNRR